MVEFCELCVIFLSTPSARRATFNKVHKTNLKYISIHALCEEGDLTRTALLLFLWIFLSTPSARRATVCVMNYREFLEQFLSTPSARRATHHAGAAG